MSPIIRFKPLLGLALATQLFAGHAMAENRIDTQRPDAPVLAAYGSFEVGTRPIDDHQQQRARHPGRVAFPLKPGQVFRHCFRCHHVFLDMIKATTVDLPFFPVRSRSGIKRLPEAKIQRDEVE